MLVNLCGYTSLLLIIFYSLTSCSSDRIQCNYMIDDSTKLSVYYTITDINLNDYYCEKEIELIKSNDTISFDLPQSERCDFLLD